MDKGRQQTLGKFFKKPEGAKSDPLQQATLKEMSQRSLSRSNSSSQAMDVDAKSDTVEPEPSGNRKRPAKRPAEEDEDDEDDMPIQRKAKRHKKMVTSDDEDARTTPTLESSPRNSTPAIEDLMEEDEAPAPKPTKKKPAPKTTRQTKLAAKGSSKEDASSKILGIVEDDNGADLDADIGDEEGVGASISTTAEQLIRGTYSIDFEGDWNGNDPAPYALLAHAFSLIEGTTKRIEKTCYLTSMLHLIISKSRGPDGDRQADAKTLIQAVYLCINRLSPDYEGVELGIGESLLIKAIGDAFGRKPASVKSELQTEGDLGVIAMKSKAKQKAMFKPKPLTIPTTFSLLKDIALTSGNQSQAKKTGIIVRLLAACSGQLGKAMSPEAKFIIRSCEGKLRIGLAERTLVLALAYATVLDERDRGDKKWSKEKLSAKLEGGSSILKQVFSEIPSYDLVIPALLEHGIENLKEHCKLTPGIPLKPMLAKPTKAIGEVLDRFEGKRFTCEYKYDGERAQVHRLEDGTIAVFSRNSEDMTKKYPEFKDQIPRCIKGSTKSFVLDAEAVAIDRTTAKLQPFQELSKRKRKDVKVEDITIQVCLFAFDILYLNGEPLLHKSLAERRQLLKEHFVPVNCEFDFAKSSDGETSEEIQEFLNDSVKDGCEGLMVKMLDSDASFYEPSRRSVNWLKIKKDYLDGVGDSLDLVVVGAYYGKGKRTNVYGAFLLAVYDADAEEWQTICKIGTGFSDEALQKHSETLKPLVISEPVGVQVGGAKPDVWFEPKIVWEVLTADLSLSPVYVAARGIADNERGISLRFPRFIRERDDKDADDATGPEQVAEMYQRQVLAQGQGKKKGGADDDYW